MSPSACSSRVVSRCWCATTRRRRRAVPPLLRQPPGAAAPPRRRAVCCRQRGRDQPRMVVTIPVGDRTGRHLRRHAYLSQRRGIHRGALVGAGRRHPVHRPAQLLPGAQSPRTGQSHSRLTQTIYEREELFRQLAETVDVVFWAINADATRLEYIGPAFRQIAGDERRARQYGAIADARRLRADDRRTLVEAIGQLQAEGGRFTVVLPVSLWRRKSALAARLRLPGARRAAS
jgi:hypothetical protein